MASGVEITDEVKNGYNDLKNKHKYSFMLLKISSDLKRIEIEKTHDKDEKADSDCYDDFVAALPKNDCRYGVCELMFTLDDGGKREKIAFFAWCPESAPIKSKMLYAASKEALKKVFPGHNVDIQANDTDELERKEIVEKLKKK